MTRSRSSDDEISHILEHFQSKPEFLAVVPGIPGRTTKRNRRVIVRYKKCVPCLDISYLLFHHSGRILRFRFRVSTPPAGGPPPKRPGSASRSGTSPAPPRSSPKSSSTPHPPRASPASASRPGPVYT
uniref:Uncharacterized protein n=1 Tax=Corethron hystrix TaxID=216773 RepID=A0A7S1BNR6_9STRA|mmetsp:Transcript_35356/g.81964  ORF Transcript_35356/g.81964 Transcript_35356/m.81964 type:complete len:128 (+) Transcript_35356:188-571(+)